MKRLYLIVAIIGVILTPIAHKVATAQRGYWAIGGEILIVPLFMLIVLAGDQVEEAITEFKEIFRAEDDEECQKEKAPSTTRC